jgi:hypothetical protein
MELYKPFRTITLPKCPYCNIRFSNCSPSNYEWQKLVGLATGSGSSNIKIKCENCGRDYRVKCNIRFFGSGE